jgi:hypothetical protein
MILKVKPPTDSLTGNLHLNSVGWCSRPFCIVDAWTSISPSFWALLTPRLFLPWITPSHDNAGGVIPLCSFAEYCSYCIRTTASPPIHLSQPISRQETHQVYPCDHLIVVKFLAWLTKTAESPKSRNLLIPPLTNAMKRLRWRCTCGGISLQNSRASLGMTVYGDVCRGGNSHTLHVATMARGEW